MTAHAGSSRFPSASATAVRWARENLFSGPLNVILTVSSMALIVVVLYQVLRFVFVSAEWQVIETNRRLFFVGRLPAGDVWRVWVIVYMLSGLAGVGLGLWTRLGWRAWLVLAVALIPVFLFIGGGRVALQTAGTVGLFSLAYVGGRSWFAEAAYPSLVLRTAVAVSANALALSISVVSVRIVLASAPPAWLAIGLYALIGALSIAYGAYLARVARTALTGNLGAARQLIVVAWLGSFVLTMHLLNGVDASLWGGLVLTMLLAVVGIVASFPLGVLLALGRASTFPVIRVFCTVYIEIVRGVPLITVLFMALFFLPLMLEADRSVAGVPLTGYELLDLDVVRRAMFALTLFSAAYVAEIVRGGLQVVPRGQVEAAKALGLGTTRVLGLIVLPQALRAVIPAMVGQFISLFKDTSLVAIMGLTELLAVARLVTAQRDFIGLQAETLLFVALIYWLIAFSMSRASQQLERTLGVGER